MKTVRHTSLFVYSTKVTFSFCEKNKLKENYDASTK